MATRSAAQAKEFAAMLGDLRELRRHDVGDVMEAVLDRSGYTAMLEEQARLR